MSGRKYSAGSSYRYGFNGKENDNDVKNVEGGQQDYGMRIYDPRVGRFLSVDPLTRSYPQLTPYQFASNRPIDGVDLDGKEWSVSTVDGVTTFTVHLKVYNESKAIKKYSELNMLLNGGADKKGNHIDGYKDYAEQKFNADFGSDKFRLNVEFEIMAGPSCDYEINKEFQLILRDVTGNDNGDGTITYSGGATYVAQTQFNHMYSTLSVDGDKLRDKKLLFRNFLHEVLHSGGLNHPWKADFGIKDLINNPAFLKKLDSDRKFRKFVGNFFKVDANKLLTDMKAAGKKNIMNSDEPRGDIPIDPTHDPADTEIRKSQFLKIKKTVKDQQKNE